MISALKLLRRYRDRLQTRNQLYRLSAHELEDIGLARGSIDEVTDRIASGR
ncbi:DUF1127 domain-containing protein [Rhodovulum sp. YNF3179]|mgnify:CR=1 FL=1|uniref:DUF1127 domain-containing protein n=1 Tax=Rhodovulum sp. YNF3179 TaxID=3425127 RepID=UPI003D3278E3